MLILIRKLEFCIQILFLLLYGTSNFSYSQSGWINQNSGTIESLNSVKFINSETGWCVGNNSKILKTTNSGNNWTVQGNNIVGNSYSLLFTSTVTGYIVGDSNLSGFVFKTTNSGNNWFPIGPKNIYPLKSIYFINKDMGFTAEFIEDMSNELAKIYFTTNAGNSWDSIQTQYKIIHDIQFLNESTGWLVGGFYEPAQDFVSKTINRGTNWTIQTNSIPPFYCVYFTDSLNGWVGGRSQFQIPSIIRTTNGGTNWLSIFPGTGTIIRSLHFINRNKGWGAGDNRTIQVTTNAGLNWTRQTIDVEGINYNSIHFTDSLNGWTVGDSGRILRTTTGGVLTSFTNQSTEIPDKYFLSQNYPNPFNPGTIISYSIPVNVKSERSTSQGGSKVKLIVYSSLGNEVATLVNERKNAGSYEVEFNGSNFSSGIYFYSLTVDGNLIDTKKMILLK